MSEKPVGLTKDVGFQAGARKTFGIEAERLWRFVISARAQAILGQEESELEAGSLGVTTFVEGSHYRRRVAGPSGTSPVLQIRVILTKNGKATIALHAEKLGSAKEREQTLRQFKATLKSFAEVLSKKE
jgi:hypothetical protein